jgi:hypothetical protein
MTSRSRPGVWLAGAALALIVAAPICLGLTAVGARRLDLVHIAFVNGCQMRSYALHWQDPARLPEPLRFDFTLSPDSLVLFELWIQDGPTLSLSQPLPLICW